MRVGASPSRKLGSSHFRSGKRQSVEASARRRPGGVPGQVCTDSKLVTLRDSTPNSTPTRCTGLPAPRNVAAYRRALSWPRAPPGPERTKILSSNSRVRTLIRRITSSLHQLMLSSVRTSNRLCAEILSSAESTTSGRGLGQQLPTNCPCRGRLPVNGRSTAQRHCPSAAGPVGWAGPTLRHAHIPTLTPNAPGHGPRVWPGVVCPRPALRG